MFLRVYLQPIKSFVWLHRWDVAVALLLLAVAAATRLTDLGTFLTADEKNWMGRSYEFIRAFKDWRFNDMLQTTHPGVTTLWLSGIAITLKLLVSGIPFSFRHLIYFVTAAQFPVALVNALAVPVLYVLLRLLLRRRLPAVFAAIFIALDPLFIGYSRVVHVDALLASFVFLAALATLLYAEQGYARRWLLISSVLGGLALLTKVPAVFLLPFFWLVVMVYGGRAVFRWAFVRERLRDFLLWTLIAGLLFVTLWPAILWVPNPEGNVLVLKRDISQAALTPHHMVEEYTLDGSFYLTTLLTKVSPVIQALVVLALVGLFARGPQRRIVFLLVAYTFFFVLMMTLGAKKGDRYILPVFPALDVLAAYGVVFCSSWVSRVLRWDEHRHGVSLTLLIGGVVVVYLAAVVFMYHPYTIAYRNPLPPEGIGQELGWGEGLEQVAAWLNEHAPDAVVASWYPEELGAYTSAQVAHINAHEQSKVRYIVLYRNMFGRAPDHPANDFIDLYYTKRDPVYVAHVAGKEFAWVYEKPVYERVVGELVFDKQVGQELVVEHDHVAGVEVLFATYSGAAQRGAVEVTVRDGRDGPVLYQERVPVEDLEDNGWLRVVFPEDGILPRDTFFVSVAAEDTLTDDAPTVRYTTQYEHRAAPVFFFDRGVWTAKDGDLGVRVLYRVGEEFVTEDETRLLQ